LNYTSTSSVGHVIVQFIDHNHTSNSMVSSANSRPAMHGWALHWALLFGYVSVWCS